MKQNTAIVDSGEAINLFREEAQEALRIGEVVHTQ